MRAAGCCVCGLVLCAAAADEAWHERFAAEAAPPMAFQGAYDEFTTVAAPMASTANATQIDFTACPDCLLDNLPATVEGLAALMPGLDSQGRPSFFGWGDARWQRLAAVGVAPAVGEWFSARIETRQFESDVFVSYLVKTNETDYARLADSDGRVWFRGGQSAEGPKELAFAGTGRASAWAGRDREAEPPRVYTWVGGDEGDWNVATNWVAELDGSGAEVPSGEGAIARVPGEVVLTREGERARVCDLVVELGGEGPQVIGGRVEADAWTVDVSRPQLGVPLGAELPSIFGVHPACTFVWRRGSAADGSGEVVSEASAYAPQLADREHWLSVVARDASGTHARKSFYFSTLPVMYLDVEGGAPSAAKEVHDSTVTIQGNAVWPAQEVGASDIKVRGNTTVNYTKKPYKLKLAKKTNLFGMGKNKHWVLLANYNDMSQMRNKLAGDFANDIGFLGMDSTWVQCVLNGDFIGTYLLSEHVRPGKQRVPVYDWEDEVADKTDLSAIGQAGEDISGGYLFEFSEEYDELTRFTTTAGNLQMRTMVLKPEYLYTNDAMMEFCQSFLQNYWDACVAADRCSKEGHHYSFYCDVDSMVDFFLVNELFANTDACKHSRFAYLDRGGKLTWGPVWDFDCSSGYIGAGTSTPTVWTCAGTLRGDLSKKYSMQKEWSSDYYFCQRLHARYAEIRAAFGELFADGGRIDRAAEELAVPCAANDARWPRERTFAEDAAILKEFLSARAVWLDRQFTSVTGLIASLRNSQQTTPSTWKPDAVVAIAEEEVSVPLAWVREQIVTKDADRLSATAKQLSAAAQAVPNLWGKNVPLWQDYVAGTNPDPTAADSVFSITSIAVTNGTAALTWSPDLGSARRYVIEGRSTLDGTWHAPTTAADRFFRVRVSLPK